MKTVYLLGAGASIGNTSGKFPGIDTFFSVGKELNIINETTKKIRSEFLELDKYVSTILKKNIIVKSDKINVETLMTFLELEIEVSNESYYYDLKSKLNMIIRDVIINAAGAFWTDQMNCEYKMLSYLLKKQDTIITYNWDTMLDDVLGRKYLIAERHSSLSYHKPELIENQYYNLLYNISAVSFETYTHASIEKPYSQYSNDKGYYLKQHGSIDWNFCTNKECRAYGAIFPLDEHNSNGFFCSECHSRLEILIVPPLLNKKIRSFPVLNKVWNLAAQEISNCQRLVIWGYSFPPTDFYSKWLISKYSTSISELVIINPDIIRKSKENVTRNAIFIENIKTIIAMEEMRVTYYEYFVDYKNGIDINHKYGISIL